MSIDIESPFAKYADKAWPFWYRGEVLVERICGGVPSQEKTAEAWIRTKLKDTRSESEIRALVEVTKEEIRETHKAAGRKTQAEMALEAEETEATALLSDDELTDQAVTKVASDMAGFNMFKRSKEGILYIEGRQLKAAMKEAVAVAANAGLLPTKGWGNPDNAAYKKQLKGWFPEHVFVTDHTLPLYSAVQVGGTVEMGDPITEPSRVIQKFVHTHRGDAIGYEETLDQAMVRFTAKTNVELTEENWAMIWLTGEDQGLGASRSQGYGTYQMVRWEQMTPREAREAARNQTPLIPA